MLLQYCTAVVVTALTLLIEHFVQSTNRTGIVCSNRVLQWQINTKQMTNYADDGANVVRCVLQSNRWNMRRVMRCVFSFSGNRLWCQWYLCSPPQHTWPHLPGVIIHVGTIHNFACLWSMLLTKFVKGIHSASLHLHFHFPRFINISIGAPLAITHFVKQNIPVEFIEYIWTEGSHFPQMFRTWQWGNEREA